ncbi:hypothetical protein BCR42DRAFT_401530 [Absidia repens]|uniref:F-box domain-containing protein n=1 Tax=Absidia repens TaxID=90262 RepID=A0A1X2J2Q9_9FUNG|nr:hypothetical protein BCR42DRAFT_401530 [Absidia repens]
MDRLSSLPSETLWKILSYLTAHDLSCIRMANKKLAVFADHPSHWRHLHLAPPQQYEEEQKVVSFSSSTLTLWSLKDLQRLVGPHRKIIESIQIWGVRDNIVRYILSSCVNLTDLTLCGWATLSDHAFKQLHSDLKLQRLMLVGAPEQPNYTSLDATTLAQLLMQCPLKELSLGCQVHIHAETLLLELHKRQRHEHRRRRQQQLHLQLQNFSFSSPPPEKQHLSTAPVPVSPSVKQTASSSSSSTYSNSNNKNRFACSEESSSLQLQRLTLATRRTWSTEHVMALFNTCPSLHHVCLFPAAAAGGFDLAQTKKMCDIMDRQQQQQMNDGDNVADMMVHHSTERTVAWLV